MASYVADLAPQRADHAGAEIDLREFLSAARAPWTEYVELHELVSDDVQADQKHAVPDAFQGSVFGELQILVGDCHGGHFAVGMNVAPHVVAVADRPEGRVPA